MFADVVTCYPKVQDKIFLNREPFLYFFLIFKPNRSVNFEQLFFVTATVTKIWVVCVCATILSIMTFSIMTLSVTTFSITTLSIMGLFTILSINDIQHNGMECHYAECHQVQGRIFIDMLSVIMLSVTAFKSCHTLRIDSQYLKPTLKRSMQMAR